MKSRNQDGRRGLNPDEPDTIALLNVIEKIDNSKTDQEFADNEAQMLNVARRLLKREWDRIKDELTRPNTE